MRTEVMIVPERLTVGREKRRAVHRIGWRRRSGGEGRGDDKSRMSSAAILYITSAGRFIIRPGGNGRSIGKDFETRQRPTPADRGWMRGESARLSRTGASLDGI
jgi:hypothetical protein